MRWRLRLVASRRWRPSYQISTPTPMISANAAPTSRSDANRWSVRRRPDSLPHRCHTWLRNMDLALLDTVLAERGEPRFRAGQIWDWLARGAGSYEEMTNIPAALRAGLEDAVPLS